MHLARSYLFVPASHQRLLQKAFTAGADAVVLDLEDGVALEHKALARQQVREALAARGPDACQPLVVVRINSVSSGLWREDLDAVVCAGVHAIRLANAESGEQVAVVADLLGRLEGQRGLPAGSIAIIPSIESAAAVLAADEVARAPRVFALAFGATDFLHDIGAGPDAGDLETAAVKTHLVVISRAACLAPPIAPVFPRLGDLDELRRSSVAARRIGFLGRSCIHPAQLPVVHEVFTPSPEQLTEARAIVEAADSHAGAGDLRLPDGRLVARPLVDRARALLDLARRIHQTANVGRSA